MLYLTLVSSDWDSEREHDREVRVCFDDETRELIHTLITVLKGPIEVKIIGTTPTQPVATRAVLVIKKEQSMPGAITVDTTNETVTLEFTDDKGDTAAAPVSASGSALVVTFTSDNTAAATVATDATNPLQGDITPVAVGSANIGATFAYADGTPVLEADGVTAFPTPAPAAVTVSAGAATGDALVLSA